MEKRILAKCGRKKAKCGRKKALFGSQEAATLAAAGITAAATAAAAKMSSDATKNAADAQADSQKSAAQKQADAITKQSDLAKQSQLESQEFIKEQNERNRQLQQDIQLQLQMLTGQQNNNDRLEASKLVVRNGGKTKSRCSLRGSYDGNNIPFKVTDGGYVVPVAKTPEGFNLFEIKGNDHEHYHKTSGGKNKTGVGIKFADGNVVEGEGNQNTNQGEYMLQTPDGAYFISKHSVAGFNPAKAVNEGMHPIMAFNIQEQQKYMNGITDSGKKISSPLKGNKKLAGGIMPTIYNMYNQTGPQLGIDTIGDTVVGSTYAVNHRKLACGGRHKKLACGGRHKAKIGDIISNIGNELGFTKSDFKRMRSDLADMPIIGDFVNYVSGDENNENTIQLVDPRTGNVINAPYSSNENEAGLLGYIGGPVKTLYNKATQYGIERAIASNYKRVPANNRVAISNKTQKAENKILDKLQKATTKREITLNEKPNITQQYSHNRAVNKSVNFTTGTQKPKPVTKTTTKSKVSQPVNNTTTNNKTNITAEDIKKGRKYAKYSAISGAIGGLSLLGLDYINKAKNAKAYNNTKTNNNSYKQNNNSNSGNTKKTNNVNSKSNYEPVSTIPTVTVTAKRKSNAVNTKNNNNTNNNSKVNKNNVVKTNTANNNKRFNNFKEAFDYYHNKLGEGKTFEYEGIKYSTNKGSKEDEERNARWAKRRTQAVTRQIANKYFDKDQSGNSWKTYLQRANRTKVFRNGGAIFVNDNRRSLKCGGKVRRKAKNGYWDWNTGSWVTDTPTEAITVPYKPEVQPSTPAPSNSTTSTGTRSSSGNWLSNNANVIGAGLGALSNIGGALMSSSANRYAAKKLSEANTVAANMVADAYRNLQTINPSSIRREDYAVAHAMPALQAPISQANSQIALANRQLQRRLDNARKYSASSVGAQTRMTGAEIDTQDIKNTINAKDQEQMQKVRQDNAQRISEAALQNAQLDAEANRQYHDAYLNVLQYNNNIKNQRILGAANALSEGTINSANAMANASTANSSAWNNAILNSAQGFGNTLSAIAARKADLEKVLLGASGDARSNYYANIGSYTDAKNYYNNLIRQYNLIQNSNKPEDQDTKAYLKRLINTIATSRNFETV